MGLSKIIYILLVYEIITLDINMFLFVTCKRLIVIILEENKTSLSI